MLPGAHAPCPICEIIEAADLPPVTGNLAFDVCPVCGGTHLTSVEGAVCDACDPGDPRRGASSPQPPPSLGDFESELRALLNRHNREAGSNTPDHILVGYVMGALDVYNHAVNERERWYGRVPEPAGPELAAQLSAKHEPKLSVTP